MDRINFAVQDELQELVEELKEVKMDTRKARAIYEQGYSTVYAISKAKAMAIMKCLQKTLVISQQFSTNFDNLFKQGALDVNSANNDFPTLQKAEEIINGAKKVRKRHCLQRAREVILEDTRKKREDTIMKGIEEER